MVMFSLFEWVYFALIGITWIVALVFAVSLIRWLNRH